MAEPLPPQDPQSLPSPNVKMRHRWSLSLIWLVPLIAALVGLVLVVRAYLASGPVLRISFTTAEGLEAGATEVRYKNVVIGRVRAIDLSDDHDYVAVVVDLNKSAASLAVEDTRFWVVRPRIDLGGVSGLGTLVSGSYIAVDVGKSAERRTEFEGLEVPPPVTNDQKGRRFLLHSADLGSLNLGSPIYFRRVPVGRVVGFSLDETGGGVTLQVFVDAPYDRFVTRNVRFWNASGVDVSVGASGFKVNTESLVSVFSGGLAFQTLSGPIGDAAPENGEFMVYEDQAKALALPAGPPIDIRMRFSQSIRGLGVGAPVDFKGIELGSVKYVGMDYERSSKTFVSEIVAEIYPQRLGQAYERLVNSSDGSEKSHQAVLGRLVERGLRAQLRTGNLITGQLYVALDFMPKAAAARIDTSKLPLEVPTAPGDFEQVQSQIVDIVRKIDEIPFAELGGSLRDSLVSMDKLLKQFDTELAPEARQLLSEARKTLDAANQAMAADSPVTQDARQTLEEVERTARSLRALSDYLQRHPESLIRGRPDDPDAAAVPP